MSARGSKEVRLVYGASPRVDLLPPEVADRKRGAAMRRALVMGVIGALVVSAGGYALASWQTAQAADELSAAQLETTALVAQQGEFAEVKTLTGLRDTITEARQTGALAEIDWSLFYADLKATLPRGALLDQIIIAGNSPIRELVPPTFPTHGPRAAQISVMIVSPDLQTVAALLVNLKSLPGYADATATPAIALGSGYSTTVLMNVTSDRYTKRFAPPADPAAETPATAAVTEGEGAN